jgi:hypothetical protein
MPSIINATTTTGVAVTGDNSGSLALQTNNGTTAVTITTGQNVAIGTTATTQKLWVNNGNVCVTNDYAFGFHSNPSAGGISNYYSGSDDTNYLRMFTGGSERMRITSGGSLCIGRTTNIFGSGAGLCVETNSNSINAVVTNSGQSALSAVNTAVNTGTSCSLMSFNVGISGGGSQVGTVSYNGTLVQYNTTSDQRLKKNIVDAGSGLAKLANVKIRAFDWVEHDSHTDFGVVAQELVTVAPEAVNIGDTGKTIERIWGVDTSTLVPAMIKAIQELNAKVDAQALEIQALKGVA